MNQKEMTAEILNDISKLERSTKERLFQEYVRERKKRKIDKAATYPKVYPIKTAAKNTWLVFVRKSPIDKKFTGLDAIAFCLLVYYYDRWGLKVFRHCQETGMMEEFTGHFFTRYNERMHLNITSPIETVKVFFNSSGYFQYQLAHKSPKGETFGLCKDGVALGKYFADYNWILNRTFISREMMKDNQAIIKNELIGSVQLKILTHLFTEEETDQVFMETQQHLLKELIAA